VEWRGEGVLLSVRRHGEDAAIIEVLSEDRGRHLGVVRGGASRRMAPTLQPGAQLDLAWRARLSDHLGQFTVEPRRDRAGALLADPAALAGLSAVCALLSRSLPERDPQPGLYAATVTLLDALALRPDWPLAYLLWERVLLDQLGFGLDLTRCAVTGAAEGLAFVSPRTGRAVSRAGAGDWADRLLPLPDCLRDGAGGGLADLLAGLEVTGHFLRRQTEAEANGQGLPEARHRLIAILSRQVDR
jgi:DNA repair protein RecO (recombination protein O)